MVPQNPTLPAGFDMGWITPPPDGYLTDTLTGPSRFRPTFPRSGAELPTTSAVGQFYLTVQFHLHAVCVYLVPR